MSVAWLRDLEERVGDAASELRSLRDKNAELQTQVETLEAKLAAAEKASTESDGWQTERDEIKSRVEGLVSHLEELLADDA